MQEKLWEWFQPLMTKENVRHRSEFQLTICCDNIPIWEGNFPPQKGMKQAIQERLVNALTPRCEWIGEAAWLNGEWNAYFQTQESQQEVLCRLIRQKSQKKIKRRDEK